MDIQLGTYGMKILLKSRPNVGVSKHDNFSSHSPQGISASRCRRYRLPGLTRLGSQCYDASGPTSTLGSCPE
ncbi:hypothetical protein IG631_07725 [Alternaria alternata]|nr:hypothetical protein IG631_07725 [Alternaria alternata]